MRGDAEVARRGLDQHGVRRQDAVPLRGLRPSRGGLELDRAGEVEALALEVQRASTIDRRSTYRSSSLKACGTDMTVTTVSSGVAAHAAARGNRYNGGTGARADRPSQCRAGGVGV
jgi:hypothetical protein